MDFCCYEAKALANYAANKTPDSTTAILSYYWKTMGYPVSTTDAAVNQCHYTYTAAEAAISNAALSETVTITTGKDFTVDKADGWKIQYGNCQFVGS